MSTIYSSSVGNKWHGVKPETRRTNNTDRKPKKK